MFVAILKVVIINCRDFHIMKGFSKENRDLFFAAWLVLREHSVSSLPY